MKPMSGGKQKTYVVFHGRAPGIYSTWAEAQYQVNGFSGASYQSFKDSESAEVAWALYCRRWEQNMDDHAVADETMNVQVPVAIGHEQSQLEIIGTLGGAQSEEPIVNVHPSTSNPNIVGSAQFVHHGNNGGERLVEGILIGFLMAMVTMFMTSYFKL